MNVVGLGLLMERSGVRIAVARTFHAAECAAVSASFKGLSRPACLPCCILIHILCTPVKTCVLQFPPLVLPAPRLEVCRSAKLRARHAFVHQDRRCGRGGTATSPAPPFRQVFLRFALRQRPELRDAAWSLPHSTGHLWRFFRRWKMLLAFRRSAGLQKIFRRTFQSAGPLAPSTNS